MENATTTENNTEKGSTMTFADVKKAIKGCTLIIWRAGFDTKDSSTGRKAHAILRECIELEDDCTIGSVVVIGKTAWIDEQSWVDAHKEVR